MQENRLPNPGNELRDKDKGEYREDERHGLVRVNEANLKDVYPNPTLRLTRLL
jgi:hypothetical protein